MATIIEEFPDGYEPQPNKKSCKGCKYFCAYIYEFDTEQPDDQLVSDYGECRRFPPKLVADDESGFPIVEETMWCGEFDF